MPLSGDIILMARRGGRGGERLLISSSLSFDEKYTKVPYISTHRRSWGEMKANETERGKIINQHSLFIFIGSRYNQSEAKNKMRNFIKELFSASSVLAAKL